MDTLFSIVKTEINEVTLDMGHIFLAKFLFWEKLI